jgi:endogenous inhibitor of DNA gyrase (YacG/DUF329 family)
MAKRVLNLRCPTCRKIVLRSDPEFPFCSDRCRLIDLGKWASGGYVISTPISDPENVDFTPRSTSRVQQEGSGTTAYRNQNERRRNH